MLKTFRYGGTFSDWCLTVEITSCEENPEHPLPAPDLTSLEEHFRLLFEVSESHAALDEVTD